MEAAATDTYGIRRGDIRNFNYACKAKEYAFSCLCRYLPRGISPTDIDGLIEINGNFLNFEFKTTECDVSRGQALMMEWFLYRMQEYGTWLIPEHDAFKRKVEAVYVRTLAIWWWDADRRCIVKTNRFDTHENDMHNWIKMWVSHAEGNSEEFLFECKRKFRESGGLLCCPPLSLRMPERQIKRHALE